MTSVDKYIVMRGVRVNNLKNIDVDIPRGLFTVVTGLSGSGKSSLAFDTLYAEGQRRYVESLSAYARQFMGRMAKPQADKIAGLPPAIAIEQKVNTRNPRSTVGTSTEIYDYLRLLMARVGTTYSPVSGREVMRHTPADLLHKAMTYAEGTRIAVVAPIVLPEGRSFLAQLDIYLKGGYTRLIKGGEFVNIAELIQSTALADESPDDYLLLIDRMSVDASPDEQSRLAEDAETAFYEGHGKAALLAWGEGGAIERSDFSILFEADGITFREPTEQMFNFNNPYGACTVCEGFGKTTGIDERLVVPDPSLSVYDDAVVCWRGEKMSQWKHDFISVASKINFPIHTPYGELTDEQKRVLWEGTGSFTGINGFFKMVEENLYKIQYRVMLARYRGKTICPECHGTRLRPDAMYVKIDGMTIADMVSMPVSRLYERIKAIDFSADPAKAAISARLLKEIVQRLEFMLDVGLGYLTLDRLSATLSGGESQRINLATSLGSSLMGSLYILDEPSIGLHSRDTHRLIQVLRKLQQQGNTVVVVEHDRDIIQAADHLIDVGPDAGSNGGRIVYSGTPHPAPDTPHNGYTLDYLSGRRSIAVPKVRRPWRDYIELHHVSEHNLKNIDVKFPLHVMTVVTGVSGSGKSTLVRDVLYRALARHLGEATDAPGAFRSMSGDLKSVSAVEFVDQNPIGKSSRSNSATYLKAFDEIRHLMADQQGAKQMGFGPGFFSFNTEGGRCEQCKGEGTVTIEMQFMADITIECDQCHGRRFKPDILDIRYRDKNISDILDMTVDEAIEFFSASDGVTERRIVKRLTPLSQVGLGYIKLGQSSSTLSGGENQRVKLAYYLSVEKASPTVFIFDEPTTGLHLHDINTLMKSFDRLIDAGHTVIVIEHNMDVIKCADHVIDIGPEGGDEGGRIVAAGTPEQVAECEASYTGRYLKEVL